MVKNIIKSVTFLAILLTCIVFLSNNVFSVKTSDPSQYEAYYWLRDALHTLHEQPSDTVDVILVGSSQIMFSYSPAQSYDIAGITSMLWGTLGENSDSIIWKLKDIIPKQHPKLIIIESNRLSANQPHTDIVDLTIDNITDYSLKAQAYSAMSASRTQVRSPYTYILPIFWHHTQWKNLVEHGNLTPNIDPTMGTVDYSFIYQHYPVVIPRTEDSADLQLELKQADILKKLLEYLNGIETKVLFLAVPDAYTEDDQYYNAIDDTIKEYGFEFLNCDRNDFITDIGINLETDFRDVSHMSTGGREKFTNYIASYISDNYGIVDHRGDPKYKLWENAYASYIAISEQQRNESK
jgi:hypothetical protein